MRRAAIFITLFVLAAGVRILAWQNNAVNMGGVQYVLTQLYIKDAKRLTSGDPATFITGDDPPSDATILLHPPGYALLIAAVYGVIGENIDAFRIVQILLSSLAPILIFMIGSRLFGERVGIIAGVLVALSPQSAYYAGLILADGLAVLPILAAIYLLVRLVEAQQLRFAILCGASLGLSCWLRSNALMLPLFFAASVLLLPRGGRSRLALAIIAAFILTIAPITIRNYAVFGGFIPLSVGMGTTFVEGLGDIDRDGSHGMPTTDEGVMEMDKRLSGRPDYSPSLYDPDGLFREKIRLRAGLDVVASDPVWYAAGVARRAQNAFRLERVPVAAPEIDERETTPALAYYLNVPLKLFQRIFITAIFLPLALLGGFIMWRKRIGAAWVVAIVPLYYASFQSLLHTEYRYLLPASHMIMLAAAVGVGFLADQIILTPRRSDIDRQA